MLHYARHMRDALPNASFIGFTGTPIELADASTRAVFGDHISVYDIQRAAEDGATVQIDEPIRRRSVCPLVAEALAVGACGADVRACV